MILVFKKIKDWSKLSWVFIKAHWKFFVGVLVPVVIMILLRKRGSIEILNKGIERKNKLIEEEKKVLLEEQERKVKAIEEYKKATEKVQREYEKSKKSLTSREKKIIKEIILEADGDQEVLTKKLKERFNL